MCCCILLHFSGTRMSDLFPWAFGSRLGWVLQLVGKTCLRDYIKNNPSNGRWVLTQIHIPTCGLNLNNHVLVEFKESSGKVHKQLLYGRFQLEAQTVLELPSATTWVPLFKCPSAVFQRVFGSLDQELFQLTWNKFELVFELILQ